MAKNNKNVSRSKSKTKNDKLEELSVKDYFEGLTPSEIILEIAGWLDSWDDYKAFQQVNKRTRRILDYRKSQFKTLSSPYRPGQFVHFAQELLEIEKSTLVSDLKRLANIDPRKSTFRDGFGYEMYQADLVTEEENRIWFRNVLGLCERLRTAPVSKFHTLFENFTATNQHSRLFLANVEARTPL
ncbi:hypothetical protein BJ508DRAFT_337049, partial [Ascobolus immersus RN42]